MFRELEELKSIGLRCGEKSKGGEEEEAKRARGSIY